MNSELLQVVLKIMQLPHPDWWDVFREARERPPRAGMPKRIWPDDDQRTRTPDTRVPHEWHEGLARAMETLSDESILDAWEDMLEPRDPLLLEACRNIDAMPREHVGGVAFSSGSFRLKMAIPLSFLHFRSPSDRLGLRLLQLGIREEDPSWNRCFLQPAIRCLGLLRVLQEYIRAFTQGDDATKAGVMNALYWSRYDHRGLSGPPRHTEDRQHLAALQKRLHLLVIDTFLQGDERTHVRLMQSAIATTSGLDRGSFRSRQERDRCLQKASASSDDYIRNRADVMRGTAPTLLPLPHAPDTHSRRSDSGFRIL